MKLRNPFKHMFDGFKPFDEEQKAALKLEEELKAQFKRDRELRERIKHYVRVMRKNKEAAKNEQSRTQD